MKNYPRTCEQVGCKRVIRAPAEFRIGDGAAVTMDACGPCARGILIELLPTKKASK